MKKTLLIYALLVPLVIILFDQWSKYAVIQSFGVPLNICEINPAPGLKHEITGLFDFSLICNQGISWGLLQGDSNIKRWLLTIFALGMSGVLVYALTQSKDWLNKLSIGFIIGGALGNGIDRLLFGAVTDFIDFSDIGFRWVFNIADSAITVGVIGLIAASFLIKPGDKIHTEQQ
jgi:signal peptidase II